MPALKPLFMASAMGLLMGSVVALPSSDTKSQSPNPILISDISAHDLSPRAVAHNSTICYAPSAPGYLNEDAVVVGEHIGKFCAAKMGTVLSRGDAAFAEPLALSGGHFLNLAITNLNCNESVTIGSECTIAFGYLEDQCTAGSPVQNQGGQVTNGCASYTMHVNPSSRGDKLDARDENLTCLPPYGPGFKSADWDAAIKYIDQFCKDKNGVGVTQSNAAVEGPFTFPGDSSIEVLISNVQCSDPKMISTSDCQGMFGVILQDCWSATYPIKMVGGLYYTGCGYAIIQPSGSSTLEKRCLGCGRCLSTNSSCNPPAWDRCTPSEKACLVGQAQDTQACLMAGSCAGWA